MLINNYKIEVIMRYGIDDYELTEITIDQLLGYRDEGIVSDFVYPESTPEEERLPIKLIDFYKQAKGMK